MTTPCTNDGCAGHVDEPKVTWLSFSEWKRTAKCHDCRMKEAGASGSPGGAGGMGGYSKCGICGCEFFMECNNCARANAILRRLWEIEQQLYVEPENDVVFKGAPTFIITFPEGSKLDMRGGCGGSEPCGSQACVHPGHAPCGCTKNGGDGSCKHPTCPMRQS